MRCKREMPLSVYLFTSHCLYLHIDHRKKKTEAKE